MADPVHPSIDPRGIAEGEVLHDTGERCFPCLDGKVDVVCHQAVRMDAVAEFLDPLLEEEVKPVPVAILKEDVLFGVSAQDDVVEGAGKVYALFAGHGEIISFKSKKASLTPPGFSMDVRSQYPVDHETRSKGTGEISVK